MDEDLLKKAKENAKSKIDSTSKDSSVNNVDLEDYLKEISKDNFTGEKVFERIYRDCVVMINDSLVISDPITSSSFVISEHVTSVNVNYNVDSPPGTCDITIRTPNYMVEGEKVNFSSLTSYFNEYDEVRVFMKNRFPTKKEKYKTKGITNSSSFGEGKGDYGYSQVFWGLVTRIVDTDNKEENSININCQDMTWWLSKMKMNTHISQRDTSTNTQVGHISNVFGNMTCHEILLYILEVRTEDFVINLGPETDRRTGVVDSVGNLKLELWKQRYLDLKDALEMPGASVKVDDKKKKENVKRKKTDDAVSEMGFLNPSESVKKVDASNNDVRDQTVILDERFLRGIGPYDYYVKKGTYESEFKNRLEVIQDLARLIGFEFFQDTNGSIVFKPPYYNMPVYENANPIYVVKKLDLIEGDFTVDANEVVTEIRGNGRRPHNSGSNPDIFAHYRDGVLASKYGLHETSVTVHWASTSQAVLYFLVGELDRLDARRYTSSLQIEGRPELRIGRPIYLSWRDEYYYIRGISHSFSNGSFKTSLELDSRRRKFTHPVTKERGVKNVLANITKVESKSADGKETGKEYGAVFLSQNVSYSDGDGGGKEGIGVFNIPDEGIASKISIYVSDSDGYEMIGSFPYGKLHSFNSKGVLVPNEEAKSSISNINTDVFASISTKPDLLDVAERQEGHPDLSDDRFNPSKKNFLDAIFKVGLNLATSAGVALSMPKINEKLNKIKVKL